MSLDLEVISDPRFILLAWAAGLALVAGSVSLARIIGPGFTWLTAGSAGSISLVGVLTSGAGWAWIGLASLVVGLVWARNRAFAGSMLTVAGFGFLIEASLLGGWLPAVTAAIALGGVTGEMLLGHWYLVDPRPPRRILRVIAVTGILGLLIDGLVISVVGGLPGGVAEVAFWTLLGTSIVLMVAVVASLRYPAYSGVMAATGLSYLAVLTTLGSVFVGRALVAGLGPFAI